MAAQPDTRPERHGSIPQRRVLVIATGTPVDADLIEEVRGGHDGGGVEVVVVAPVVEDSAARRVAGDLEPAEEAAWRRLDDCLARLRNGGLTADGWVGDTDPALAVEDALREFPADEVLFTERAAAQASEGTEAEVGLSPYLPGIGRGDLAALAVGIAGTIVAIVLFAAGPGPNSGAGAAQGLLALAAILINLGHAVAITLFESVRYRGGFQKFVRDVTLLYTPLAVIASLAILLIA
jgi:hypothetical protein